MLAPTVPRLFRTVPRNDRCETFRNGQFAGRGIRSKRRLDGRLRQGGPDEHAHAFPPFHIQIYDVRSFRDCFVHRSTSGVDRFLQQLQADRSAARCNVPTITLKSFHNRF
jgi:hypothetical protein